MTEIQENDILSNSSDENSNRWFSGIVGTILRVIIFQMVMNYFIGGRRNNIKNKTGELIKPLSNYFKPGDIYDLHAYLIFGRERDISQLSLEHLNELSITSNDTQNIKNLNSITEIWTIRNLIYNNSNIEVSRNISIIPPIELFDYEIEDIHNVNNDLSAFLLVYLVGKYKNAFIPMNSVELIKTMNKISDEDTLVNLLDTTETRNTNTDTGNKMVKYWKDTINIRVIYDTHEYDVSQSNVPPLSYMKYNLDESIYLPIVYPSDFWCIENNLQMLNSTSKNKSFNLKLTLDTLSLFKYTVQKQMMDTWELQSRYGLGQSQKDIMMIKRILVETNKYYLIFSLIFFILHSSFQMLAFKNDISFWNNNDSMYGLSGLSILASFVSEVVIGLYLFDSNETSWILLIEIFIGIFISAWKLWKTKIFYFSKKFPFICIKKSFDIDESRHESKNGNLSEDPTRHYDMIAIKYMSIILLPCIIGYAIYSLKYYKYKNWYSFVISTLAGTVYTFGFIMMSPQLYINYKLKSVDHLPWRFLVYKALNTFIDDIFSFIIDMPWMHRMACFRDDVIFIIYIYQRWIYRTDKNRNCKYKDNTKENIPGLAENNIQGGTQMIEDSIKRTNELKKRRNERNTQNS